MINLRENRAFLRMFSNSVLAQALVSAGNLLVGLILIRHQSADQYGYYVLVTSTVLLLVALQGAFFQPQTIVRLAHLDLAGRRELIGRLFLEQRRMLALAAALAAPVMLLLWAFEIIDARMLALVAAAALATIGSLYRESRRMILLAYRRPLDVLASDAVYIFLLVGGAALASLSPLPAATAALALALAAAVGGALLSRALWRHEAWNRVVTYGLLREIAPLGTWAVSGAAIQWSFTQGYTYLVAATLGVQAVAAIAATRLLLMPINLLSSGLSQTMLPTAAGWLPRHGATRVLRRLVWFSAGVVLLALCYCALMWGLRDWIFAVVLKKEFAQRDPLLLLWSGIFLLTVFREQLGHVIAARLRFPQLGVLTLISATFSLAVSYAAMLRMGVVGALLGFLLGESINVAGVVLLSYLETQRKVPATAP